MNRYLPHILLLTVSILFYWISSCSYALQGGELEGMELFRLFRGISSLIAFFVPLVLVVFYRLTSALMFTLLDETFDSQRMVRCLSLSFIPIILNCLIYLIVLYDIPEGGTLNEMINHQSYIGFGLSDMEEVSYICWLGFYLFFAILTQHEFGMGYGKAVAVTCMPTLMVVVGKWGMGFL
jgi:hypothetical protein